MLKPGECTPPGEQKALKCRQAAEGTSRAIGSVHASRFKLQLLFETRNSESNIVRTWSIRSQRSEGKCAKNFLMASAFSYCWC